MKHRIEGLTLSSFQTYCRATVNKTSVVSAHRQADRWAEQNSESRNESLHSWSTDFQQRSSDANGETIIFAAIVAKTLG